MLVPNIISRNSSNSNVTKSKSHLVSSCRYPSPTQDLVSRKIIRLSAAIVSSPFFPINRQEKSVQGRTNETANPYQDTRNTRISKREDWDPQDTNVAEALYYVSGISTIVQPNPLSCTRDRRRKAAYAWWECCWGIPACGGIAYPPPRCCCCT
jgi:hypothetical protein